MRKVLHVGFAKLEVSRYAVGHPVLSGSSGLSLATEFLAEWFPDNLDGFFV
jgi:hypothetical protein